MAATLKRPRPAELANGDGVTLRIRANTRQEIAAATPSGTAPRTINELLLERANEHGFKDEPIVSYPELGGGYVDYTPAQISALAEKATLYYANFVAERTSSDQPPQVVALLGPSNLDYFITLLALSKLGHTVLLLSTRIPEKAHVSLLRATNATSLVVDTAFASVGEKVRKHLPGLALGKIASRSDYDAASRVVQHENSLDPARETKNVAWIIHSSGSTSLPKPVFITHSAALGNYKSQFALVGFITLPLFHAHGLSCVFRAITTRKRIYMYDASLQLTTQHLLKALKEHPDIQVFYGVPFALKLLAESEEGTALLAGCEVVMFGGSACPKPIGDKLVRAGVLLAGHYGSTETGQLMTSFRDRSDIDWDYMRPPEALEPFLRWDEYAPGIYELVVLDGWPSKVAANQDDGSYATKDLFEKHPTKNAWRYHARKDDTIVLSNGEKANPLLLEGVAKENAVVAEAVVFGAQKPHVGMFVVPATPAATRAVVANAIWPAVEEANKVLPGHARLSKDMIRLLPVNAEFRKTDKSTVIRAAFYKQFAQLIDSIYEEPAPKGSLVLDEEGLHAYLRTKLQNLVQSDRQDLLRDDTDLFSLGVDSLQASQLRAVILKDIDTGKQTLSQNFVFDFPSISAMAMELIRMRTGEAEKERLSIEERMQAMIEKYSDFTQHKLVQALSEGTAVVVTGATGSLGAHLVAQLAAMDNVAAVYCLVRAASDEEALQRVRRSMQQRKVDSSGLSSNVVCLASDLSDSKLGLSETAYTTLTSRVTSVIHCAWSVNFKLSLESFEKDCVAGTKHLIDLCLQANLPKPASFNFCSSVSAVAATPGRSAPEAIPSSLSYAQAMGYAQSKLVTEHICMNAAKATGVIARVLRTGQIIGDSEHGIWNAQEAIPMIFQCAETIGALPKLEESPSWLPVDTVAAGLAELSIHDNVEGGVYNVCNHRTFQWHDLLRYLEAAGLDFDAVDQREWLRRLRKHPDPTTNPPYKLHEFFTSKYDRGEPRNGITYLSDKARNASPALANAPVLNQPMVDVIVRHLQSVW